MRVTTVRMCEQTTGRKTPKLLSTAIPRSEPHPELTRLILITIKDDILRSTITINFRCNNPRLTFLFSFRTNAREIGDSRQLSARNLVPATAALLFVLIFCFITEMGKPYLLLATTIAAWFICWSAKNKFKKRQLIYLIPHLHRSHLRLLGIHHHHQNSLHLRRLGNRRRHRSSYLYSLAFESIASEDETNRTKKLTRRRPHDHRIYLGVRKPYQT
jgi:hypothetical protein